MKQFNQYELNQFKNIKHRLMPTFVNFRPTALADQVSYRELNKYFDHNNLAYEKIAIWTNRSLYSGNVWIQNLCHQCAESGEISLLDLLDHYIHYSVEPELDEIEKYRGALLKYDTAGLMSKKHYMSSNREAPKPYSGYFFGIARPNLHMQQINSISRFMQIITNAQRREFIGDRIKYLNLSSLDDTTRAIGITPVRVADLMIELGGLEDREFVGLKQWRNSLINYLSQEYILAYWYADEDVEIFKDSLWDVFFNLTLNDEDSVNRTIESILTGMYFSNYQQWVETIKISSDFVPPFKVHEHTFISKLYEEECDGVWGINWFMHPKDNFKSILDDILAEREKLLAIDKPLADRKPVDLPDVHELTTARELVDVGERMNICIGGENYIYKLQSPHCSYYQIGSGDTAVIIELLYKNESYYLRQAVTYSNAPVLEDNPNYVTVDKFKEHFNVLTNEQQWARAGVQHRALPENIIGLMYNGF